MLVKNTVKNLFVSSALMLSGVATCSKPVLANSSVYYTECSKKLMKCLSDGRRTGFPLSQVRLPFCRSQMC